MIFRTAGLEIAISASLHSARVDPKPQPQTLSPKPDKPQTLEALIPDTLTAEALRLRDPFDTPRLLRDQLVFRRPGLGAGFIVNPRKLEHGFRMIST